MLPNLGIFQCIFIFFSLALFLLFTRTLIITMLNHTQAPEILFFSPPPPISFCYSKWVNFIVLSSRSLNLSLLCPPYSIAEPIHWGFFFLGYCFGSCNFQFSMGFFFIFYILFICWNIYLFHNHAHKLFVYVHNNHAHNYLKSLWWLL